MSVEARKCRPRAVLTWRKANSTIFQHIEDPKLGGVIKGSLFPNSKFPVWRLSGHLSLQSHHIPSLEGRAKSELGPDLVKRVHDIAHYHSIPRDAIQGCPWNWYKSNILDSQQGLIITILERTRVEIVVFDGSHDYSVPLPLLGMCSKRRV